MLFLLLACEDEPPEHPYDLVDDGTDDTADTDDTPSGDDTGVDTVDPSSLTFEGWVATVSGSPLGFSDSIRESRVSGTMSWNRAARDTDDDPDRGLYDHHGAGAFSLSVGSRTVGGSGWSQVEVEDMSSDTFRFVDGASVWGEEDRVMTIDGRDDTELGVWFAVTDGSGEAFSDDGLPTSWPFGEITDLPHTFSIEDGGGTLLLQLDVLGDG